MRSKEQISADNLKIQLLEKLKKISELPMDLTTEIANLLLKIAQYFKINKIRLLGGDNISLPYIWVENQKLIPPDKDWSDRVLSTFLTSFDNELQPFKLHKIHDIDIPVKDGGYIILSNDKGNIGLLILKVIDKNGKELSQEIIDYLELFAAYLTLTLHSRNTIDKMSKNQDTSQRNSKIMLDPADQLARIMEQQQRMIAKDLIEGIAHGVANPLAVILANQEILEEYFNSIDYLATNKKYDNLNLINNELHGLFIDQRKAIDRLNQLLIDLRLYSQGSKLSHYKTILNHAIEQGVHLSQLRADLRNRIILELNATHDVQASTFAISQALFHVIKFIVGQSNDPNSIIHIKTQDFDEERDDPYTKVIIKSNCNIQSKDDNLDIIVATHFIKGFGGIIDVMLEKDIIIITLKFLPLVY